MHPRMALALLGATYGLIGYSFGKLAVATIGLLCLRLVEGNLWAIMLVAPALAMLAIVWLAARGLASTMGGGSSFLR